MVSLQYAYENGYYIPLLYPIFYYIFKNHLLSCTIVLKLLAINFFVHFGKDIPSAQYCSPLVKPFMRFTDTGYVATFLNHYQPELFPIAFNLHLMIAIAYWIGIALFDFSDIDYLDCNRIDNTYTKLWSYAIHTLPALFYLYNISKTKESFNYRTFVNTIGWIAIWFCMIYIPWRLLTNDPIYGVLDDSHSIYFKLGLTCIVFALVVLVNTMADKYQLVTGSLSIPYKQIKYTS